MDDVAVKYNNWIHAFDEGVRLHETLIAAHAEQCSIINHAQSRRNEIETMLAEVSKRLGKFGVRPQDAPPTPAEQAPPHGTVRPRQDVPPAPVELPPITFDDAPEIDVPVLRKPRVGESLTATVGEVLMHGQPLVRVPRPKIERMPEHQQAAVAALAEKCRPHRNLSMPPALPQPALSPQLEMTIADVVMEVMPLKSLRAVDLLLLVEIRLGRSVLSIGSALDGLERSGKLHKKYCELGVLYIRPELDRTHREAIVAIMRELDVATADEIVAAVVKADPWRKPKSVRSELSVLKNIDVVESVPINTANIDPKTRQFEPGARLIWSLKNESALQAQSAETK